MKLIALRSGKHGDTAFGLIAGVPEVYIVQFKDKSGRQVDRQFSDPEEAGRWAQKLHEEGISNDI